VPHVPIVRDSFIGTHHIIFRTGVRLNDLKEFYEATAVFRGKSSGA